jgi:hypothetical protein
MVGNISSNIGKQTTYLQGGMVRLYWGNKCIVGNLAVQAGRLKQYVENIIKIIGKIT